MVCGTQIPGTRCSFPPPRLALRPPSPALWVFFFFSSVFFFFPFVFLPCTRTPQLLCSVGFLGVYQFAWTKKSFLANVSFKYTRCGIYISCKASIRWGVRYGRKLNIKKHIIYNLFQCLTGCQNKLNSAPSLPSPPFPSPLPLPSHPPPLAPPFSLPLTPSHSLSHTREGFMRSERQHTFTLLTFTGQNSFIVRARPTPPSPPPPDPLPLTLDPLKQ